MTDADDQGQGPAALMDVIDLSGLPYPAMPPAARVLALPGQVRAVRRGPAGHPERRDGRPDPDRRRSRASRAPTSRTSGGSPTVGLRLLRRPRARRPASSMAYWGPQIKVGAAQPALNLDAGRLDQRGVLSFTFDNEGKSCRSCSSRSRSPRSRSRSRSRTSRRSTRRSGSCRRCREALHDPQAATAKLPPVRGPADRARLGRAALRRGVRHRHARRPRYGHVLERASSSACAAPGPPSTASTTSPASPTSSSAASSSSRSRSPATGSSRPSRRCRLAVPRERHDARRCRPHAAAEDAGGAGRSSTASTAARSSTTSTRCRSGGSRRWCPTSRRCPDLVGDAVRAGGRDPDRALHGAADRRRRVDRVRAGRPRLPDLGRRATGAVPPRCRSSSHLAPPGRCRFTHPDDAENGIVVSDLPGPDRRDHDQDDRPARRSSSTTPGSTFQRQGRDDHAGRADRRHQRRGAGDHMSARTPATPGTV